MTSPFTRLPRRRDRSWDVVLVTALGGGLGSCTRYAVSEWLGAPRGRFPWATFVINVVGCFVLGALMIMILDVWAPQRYVRPFLAIGVVGGFTTFSTYALETRDLIAASRPGVAAVYVLTSLVAGLFAVRAGGAIARLGTQAAPPFPRRRHRGEGMT
jgi:fluoride exporter